MSLKKITKKIGKALKNVTKDIVSITLGPGYFVTKKLWDITTDLVSPDIPSSSTYDKNNPIYTVEEGKSIAKAYGRCRIAGNIIRSNDPGDDDIRVIIGHGHGEIDSILGCRLNNIEWDYLKNVKWWNSNYSGSDHYKNSLLGTDSQTKIQVDGADLFSLNACAYRGIAHTGLKLKKNDQVGSLSGITIDGRFSKCEPIGGGTAVFTRNPAVILWDFYRNIEGYEIADLDENAFTSLSALCSAYPDNGEAPTRPSANNTTVKATSCKDNKKFAPFFAFDPQLAVEGKKQKTQWLASAKTNQRINVDLGIKIILKKIVLVNAHNKGSDTNQGIKNFVIQGSNTASDLAHTTYADSGSSWVDIQTGLTATAYSAADPYKDYSVTNSIAYRYYSIKIADGHGADHIGFRDCCFWGCSPRYTFDYNFDTKISINDAKKLIWASFNGRVIRSQGKLKPVWDWSTMADGAGGLTAKTSQYSFNMDNIVKGTFTWSYGKKPNKFTIEYIDASEGFKKTTITEKDDDDIADRGEVLSEEKAYFITQKDVAARRLKRKMRKAQYADFKCKFTGFPSAQKLEVFDLVEVTHTLPGWTAKEFIIVSKTEDENGLPEFMLESYYAGIYDDSLVAVPQTYYSTIQNPKDTPPASEDITAVMAAPGTNHNYGAVQVSFTPPVEDPFYSYTEIYASNDDVTYYYAGQSSGEDFFINGMGNLYSPGDTCYIKLVNINSAGVSELMPDDYDASVSITGYIKLANFYAGLNDFWGGNPDISNAATKIVMGNLDGVPKLALGASADAITYSGTQTGVFADGDGYLRIGSSTHGMKFDPSSGILEIPTKLKVGNIDIDGGEQRIRSTNYVSGAMGEGFSLNSDFFEVGNIACRGVFRSAVFQKDVISAVGGNFLVISSDVLDADMTAADNAVLIIEGNTAFSVGDFLRIKNGADDEWLEITNAASAPTYTVIRDKAGTYGADANPAWTKGAAVVNYGASGAGGIYMTASENNAPYLSIFTHAGEPWNTITTHIREGNLNGYAGYTSDVYGWASYIDVNNYITIDPANGIQMSGSITLTNQISSTDISDVESTNKTENNVTIIPHPGGAVYSGGSSVTGAIVITLPQSWTNTMMKFVVDVFFYTTGKSFSLDLAGYTYPGGETWFNTTANLTGSTAADNRVRFGHDGSKCCIVIGEADSIWKYPKISVRDFQAGFGNFTIDNWDDGWAVSILDDLTGYTFTADHSDALIDAAAIKNQGDLAVQNRTDLDYTDGADVTAENTAADTANVGGVASSTIAAWKMTGKTTIDGGNIETDTITASAINVSNLSAIAADLGTITAGNITIDSNGFVRGGQTDYATGTGFFLGYSGSAYKFSVGSSTNYLNFDGTDLEYSGKFIGAVAGDVPEYCVKVKERWTQSYWGPVIKVIIGRTGTYRVSFGIASEVGGGTVSGRIYKNGVAYGTLQTRNIPAWLTFSQDLSFTIGDTCELWGGGGSINYNCLLRDLTLSVDNPTNTTTSYLLSALQNNYWDF